MFFTLNSFGDILPHVTATLRVREVSISLETEDADDSWQKIGLEIQRLDDNKKRVRIEKWTDLKAKLLWWMIDLFVSPKTVYLSVDYITHKEQVEAVLDA
eukprot:GABV01015173.1.p1 GENE.GABV01015173.1~~GABV01015173.1.p1  ORF type:complete len:100 (-),score=25.16 GABV01015173.1:3-302(-)